MDIFQGLVALILLWYSPKVLGDLEVTFARCCALGSNWARKEEKCSNFQTPLQGESAEYQSACISSGYICCTRFYREQQCELGKNNAKEDNGCSITDITGGEYAKDCCEGCKLGLLGGSLGAECIMDDFNFGFPWNTAYYECCSETSNYNSSYSIDVGNEVVQNESGTPLIDLEIPDSENLCLRFPGQLCSHLCIPTKGSYACQCRDGFVISPDKKTCIQEAPEDRCTSYNPCHHLCQDTGISIECSCREGFQLESDQKTCQDINECSLGSHICIDGRQTCYNRVGSYICVNPDGTTTAPKISLNPKVESNSRENPSRYTAQEIRQTFGNQEFSEAADTKKFSGQVICPPGFTFNIESRACDDIDECAVGPDICGTGISCQNTVGSYTCLHATHNKCPDGFTFDLLLQTCIDVDECTGRSSNCDVGEFCLNTQGSYECQKNSNPRGCPAGYKYDNLKITCSDVDECAEELHGCHPESETCRNVIGAYECHLQCREGFKYRAISQSCVDTDECLEDKYACEDNSEICINLIGSFKCKSRARNEVSLFRYNTDVQSKLPNQLKKKNFDNYLVKECPSGYSYDLSNRQCLDVDECRAEIHNCSARIQSCINTLGGFICIDKNLCLPGYQRSEETSNCEDIDECREGMGKCMPGQICVNTIGTFECQVECREGFTYNPRDPAICVDINECLEKPCRRGATCMNTEGSYTCNQAEIICEPGYERKNESCVDINECENDPCSNEEECINTPGQFLCQRRSTCPAGFRRNLQSFNCIDIDECIESAPCTINARCVNTIGSYECRFMDCPIGYTRNRSLGFCEDIDECQMITHNCTTFEICVNSIGSFTCKNKDRPCDFGYRFHRSLQTCADINECQEEIHLCAAGREECENLDGGYKCNKITHPISTTHRQDIHTTTTAPSKLCETGYVYNSTTNQCKDLNECQLRLHSCPPTQRCDNTVGSYICTRVSGCGTGYTLNQNTGKCEDVNECAADLGICKSNEKCINTIGSYNCLPKINCGRGYKMNDLGTQCIDLDECVEQTHKCEGGQICLNRPGGYICQCPKGFRPDRNRNCQDINECQEYYQSICGFNSECRNTHGSYECTCKKGFAKAADDSCSDINECTTNTKSCQQKCTNIWGSYFCSCNPGYRLRHDNRTCSDIDECEEMRGKGKLCIGLCVNTPGTFRCSCPQGYRLDSDKRTCKDINECDGAAVCRTPDETCVNTRGSYECTEIRCPDDYIRDPTQPNRCKKHIICKDGDYQCRQTPLMYSYNFLPLASNMTLRQGKIDLFTMRGPIWSSTSVQFELDLDSVVPEDGVPPATKGHFQLNKTTFNQIVLVLVKPLIGPQEVILSLNMKLYHNGAYEGSAISKLTIFVSQYDF